MDCDSTDWARCEGVSAARDGVTLLAVRGEGMGMVRSLIEGIGGRL